MAKQPYNVTTQLSLFGLFCRSYATAETVKETEWDGPKQRLYQFGILSFRFETQVDWTQENPNITDFSNFCTVCSVEVYNTDP